MTRELLTIQTVTGPREALAWRLGALAIHRSLAVSGFTVTHAPSGLRLRSRIATKLDAFALAEQLQQLPIDWHAAHPLQDPAARAQAWQLCQYAPTWQRRSRAPPGGAP